MGVRPVVTGVDGSPTSSAAFALAAWQAERRSLPLHLVACHGAGTSARDDAEALVADLADRARAAFPRLAVAGEAVVGRPAATLVRRSADATLVVVGSRGRGGFKGLLLGSVGLQLTAHSAAPVIVMRPPDGPGEPGVGPKPLPVVVGVDGIPDSEAAVEFAIREAAARAAPLVVLYAWWMLPVTKLGRAGLQQPRTSTPQADLAAAEEEVRRLLAEATAGARTRHPEVEVELRPAHAMNPATALLDASVDAGLLVVSRHGGNALTRLIFSSIGDIAVREAACPVAVVPEASTLDIE